MARKRHTDLQPLATDDSLASGQHRRGSTLSSITLTNTSTLPSPNVLAARAWFLETSPPIGRDALQRRRSLNGAQDIPRRHSVMPSPGALATKLSTFNVSCADQNLAAVRETEDEGKVEFLDSGNISGSDGSEVKQNDLVKVTAVATAVKAKSASPVPGILSTVPFHFTHARLRDWGYVYLGNAATADAFINAVSLRRPSIALPKEDSTEDQAHVVTIRARVHPKAKERSPFLIQRKFDIQELRASTSSMQRRPAEQSSTPLGRSNRARRFSTLQLTTSPRRGSLGKSPEIPTTLGKGAVPIRKSTRISAI